MPLPAKRLREQVLSTHSESVKARLPFAQQLSRSNRSRISGCRTDESERLRHLCRCPIVVRVVAFWCLAVRLQARHHCVAVGGTSDNCIRAIPGVGLRSTSEAVWNDYGLLPAAHSRYRLWFRLPVFRTERCG